MAKQSAQNQDTFYVGLCMAGAVSAGAYTAGVMDYLIEALAEWEKRRGQPGVPTHKVQIPVMGGASAGGMTSVMAATAMNNTLTPIDKPGKDILAEHAENKLYHSWVDLTGLDMFSKMLATADIKPGEVLSIFNSDFIKPIAERVVDVNVEQWKPLPAFIKPDLKIFTTLTNLQGFDYYVPFNSADKSGKSKYVMVVHNDYACFQLTEKEIKGPNDGWIPLNLKEKINTDIAGAAAMATGAFPIGLASRIVDRQADYVRKNEWLEQYMYGGSVTKSPYASLNIDGGTINNEPFERVRDVLIDITGQKEANDYNSFEKFTSTVLMIEPFVTKKPAKISLDRAIPNVIGLTISTMIAQMRSKPMTIKSMMDEDCAGQFLVTPSREIEIDEKDIKNEDKDYIKKVGDKYYKEVTGDLAIACGALSGFSGFINKEFRVHDYFLGRYNCKIFLRDYFTVKESALSANPIFKDGYANAEREKFKSKNGKDGGYQIIPVFEEATDYTFPDFKFSSGNNWPTIQDNDIDKFKPALKKRAGAFILNITKPNWLLKAVLWIGTKLFLNSLLAGNILNTIKSDLRTWKLLPRELEN